jgi:hypothetical protein
MSYWLKGECPILNGVMFPDGSTECIEPRDQPRPTGTITLVARGRTSLDKHAPLESTGLIPSCRAEDKGKDVVVIGGEGGMGSDGFVAVTDLSNQLRWIAFFDFSNPFVSVELLADEIVGKNNLGEVWRFPLKNPSKITVEVSTVPKS